MMTNKSFNGWGYTAHSGAGQKKVTILESDVADLGLQNSSNWKKSKGCLPGYAGKVGLFIEEGTFYVAEAAVVVEGFTEAKVSHGTNFRDYDYINFNGQDAENAVRADSGLDIGSMMFKLK